jgi:hypothetical protein
MCLIDWCVLILNIKTCARPRPSYYNILLLPPPRAGGRRQEDEREFYLTASSMISAGLDLFGARCDDEVWDV